MNWTLHRIWKSTYRNSTRKSKKKKTISTQLHKVSSSNEQCCYPLKVHTLQSALAGEMQKLHVDYTFKNLSTSKNRRAAVCFCFRVLCMQSQDKFEILIVFVPVPDVVVRYFCFVSSARWTYPGTLIKYLHLKEHTVKLVDRKSALWERNNLVKDLKTDSLVFCFIKCGVVPFHFPFSMSILVLH